MGTALKIVKNVHNMSDLPAVLGADPWQAATEPQRRTAEMWAVVIRPLFELMKGGSSAKTVVALFMSQVDAESLSPHTKHALACLGRDGEAPSGRSIERKLSAFKAEGINGLLPKHTGRVRQDRGWEARAIEIYNTPSKPGFADVMFKLIQEGYKDVTESRVKSFIKKLPATLGEHSPARVGKHLHKLRRQTYQRRHKDDLRVGELYAGDGHRADVYLGHPNTGKPWRPEITVWIDVKSLMVVGWWVSEEESAISTLFALSKALTTYDHVPGFAYIDQGSGYRAKMLNEQSTGFYQRFAIEPIGAIPGNPHGKGWIERFFRDWRNKLDKLFRDGSVYCGDDMAEEVNRRISVEVEQGKRRLPSLDEYIEALKEFLDTYHHLPKKTLGGRTPAQVWAELQPISVELDAQAVIRPHERRTVHRQEVRLHNRHYFHQALTLYDAKEMQVEYDLHDDGSVWVFDLKGRYVCEARKVKTIGVLPISRLEERRDKSLEGQRQRIQRRLDETEARRQDAITADDQFAGLLSMDSNLTNHLNQLTPTNLTALEVVEEVEPLNILNWSQD